MTRMHSSRMHTVRCRGRLLGAEGYTPPPGNYPNPTPECRPLLQTVSMLLDYSLFYFISEAVGQKTTNSCGKNGQLLSSAEEDILVPLKLVLKQLCFQLIFPGGNVGPDV